MLTVKENYMRVMRGEVPEYVPRFNFAWGMRPSALSGNRNPDGSGTDMFGVEWTTEGSGIAGAIPKPGAFLLDDIRRWRDVIKAPDLSDVDWALMAQRDIANRDPDQPRSGGTVSLGFFQSLMSFMGFNEGLVACYEEPEEVKAMMQFLLDIFLDTGKLMLEHYKPDYGNMGDDIAHENNPFVSLAMFRDLFAPYWRAYAKIFVDADIPVQHHNCGHFEDFLDDVVDMGFSSWDPAQVSNDLVAIKAKYGNRLAIIGGFDSAQFGAWRPATEEAIRTEVKRVMDTYAPGGGYCYLGSVMGTDPVSVERSAWIADEYEKLKATYY